MSEVRQSEEVREYHAPSLQSLGSIAELTQTSPDGDGFDGIQFGYVSVGPS